ncbi:asparagine--tRNA ligase [Blattabacterium cuenoti]|uniref:asparagine--tRNA ligase n=1 Tax=Blattabacterium cuenoti TaxID=1653831 RepID=UPI00163D37B9|nr:asparagine--tRNA ligase [Blattabacterium cuenoti]
MVKKYSVKEILDKEFSILDYKVIVEGWVRSYRNSIFVILNDGSTVKNLQIILSKRMDKRITKEITIGTSVKVIGIIQKSIGEKQNIELKCSDLIIYKSVDSKKLQKSILQPKQHSLEKIRNQSHLRFQTNIFSCLMRIRHFISFSIHNFFHIKNFFCLHTPIITAYDCEGVGKMFRVTTLKNNLLDYSNDFFKRKTYLSVSGQLEAEAAIIGLGKVYTFGPVFRAENSNTTRHLSEFWMVEPEMAFFSLKECIDLAEEFLKFIIQFILDKCIEDLSFLNKNLKKWDKIKNNFLIKRLESLLNISFYRITYTNAIEILKKNKTIRFIHPVTWGMDLQSEHEKFLTNYYFKGSPVVVFDYPSSIKAFYMRVNDDNKTVSAMDILFPEIGEIIGGSQREERYKILLNRIKKFNINKNILWWYLDTRCFGSVPHSGFGLGFDRLVQFITGMDNIRDVIPFPRTPGSAEF